MARLAEGSLFVLKVNVNDSCEALVMQDACHSIPFRALSAELTFIVRATFLVPAPSFFCCQDVVGLVPRR